MRLWVRREYAPELAVVVAWLSALLPWNVTYVGDLDRGFLVFFRFALFQLVYDVGITADRFRVQHVYEAYEFQSGQTAAIPYAAWVVGAAIVLGAVVLSLLMFFEVDLPDAVDPVRLMGALQFLAGLVLLVATGLLWRYSFVDLMAPVGVLVMLGFGVVLLRVERVPDAPAAGD